MYARRRAPLFIALASAATITAEALAAAPRFKMVIGAGQAEHGVQTISLVEKPAIQRGWVALSAVEPTATKRFHFSEVGAKQVLTGPALIPGQEILRLDEKGEPFYIQFDAATIEATARQFAAQGHHNSTNQDHATALSGNVVYESWIVADPEKDKAAALGLSVEPGTWMLSIHIPDSEYWQNEVASGNKTGFSIEGLFSTEQLTLSAVKPTALSTVKNWFQKLTAKLSAEKAAEVAVTLGVIQLADGRAVNIDDATGAVTVANADGTPGEALEDGEHAIEGGGKLVVKDGVKAEEEKPVDAAKEGATEGAPTPAAEGAPADKGTEAERLDKVENQVSEILELVKKLSPEADPATAPAAPKLMAAKLHGLEVIGMIGLKLDSIELEGGDTLTLNPVSKRLANADGSLVESGYFAAADGSYFRVSTDQWFYQIDKPTYDAVYGANLMAVELAGLKATTPAAARVKLGTETGAAEAAQTGNTKQKAGLAATAHLRALQAS
jgi:hypothetical protein